MKSAGRVFRKYFFSYIGVVLMVCAITCTALLLLSANEMDRMSREERALKLQTAAKDMEAQFGIMRDVSLRIKTSVYYRPRYIHQRPINEIALIGELDKYGNYSPLISDYYLYYIGYDAVYSGTAKYSHYIFERYVLPFTGEVRGRFLRAVENAGQGEVLLFDELPGVIVLAYRVRFEVDEAILLYFVSVDALVDRICVIGGFEPSQLMLKLDDKALFGGSADARGDAITLENGLTLSVSGESTYARMSNIVRDGMFIALLAALLSSAVALVLAKRNYRPIGRLVDTYSILDGGETDEFQQIERLLKSSMEENLNSNQRMQALVALVEEQRASLKAHLFKLLIRGDSPESALQELKRLGVKLDGRCFAPVLLHMSASPFAPADVEARLNELSGDDAQMYLAEATDPERWVVLVNMEGMSSIAYAMELLNALASELGERVYARYAEVTDDVTHLPALLSVLERRESARAEAEGEYASAMLDTFRAEIKAGNSDEALSVLRERLAEAEQLYPTALDMKGVNAGVLEVLVESARQLGVSGYDECVQLALMESDGAHFVELVTPLVRKLCADIDTPNGDAKRELKEYIDAHFTEYDMSLDRLAGEFCRSDWRISRMVAEATGMPYKEYLIHLRMRLAKTLLNDSRLSVNEISERVGYANASHFIKSFKTMYGSTPAVYRYGREQEAQ